MADRPIIFSAPMVRALLDGRKTQTRRIINADIPDGHCVEHCHYCASGWGLWERGPWAGGGRCTCREVKGIRFREGDRLWVREAHVLLPRTAYRGSVGTGTIDQREHPTDGYTAAVFREGFDRSGRPLWRPSIHMPRWASRLTLGVVEVRVQRLLDISEQDAEAEGVCHFAEKGHGKESFEGLQCADRAALVCSIYGSHREAFRHLWESLNGPDAWAANPWVAAISFTVHHANIDALELGAAA